MTNDEAVRVLREALRKCTKGHFHVDGDNWYSCAAHPECGDEHRVKSYDGKCDCGADEHNQMINQALTATENAGDHGR